MAKFNFQFHAKHDELIDFVIKSANDYNLYIGLTHLSSQFHCEVFDNQNFDSFPKEILGSDEIILFQSRPIMGADNDYQFTKDNPDALHILVGADDGKILKESNLGAISDDETVAFWKKVIRPFKKSMLKGAWVMSPISGAKGYHNNRYYTEQAKTAYDNGVKICAFGVGNNIFLLEQE